MAKDRVDVIELLRKHGMDGEVDFLREVLKILADGIMDAEVSAQTSAGTVNAIPAGSLTATAGTAGRAPRTCASPRSGRAAISRLCRSRDVAVNAQHWRSSTANGPKVATTLPSTTMWSRKRHRMLKSCKPQTNAGNKDDALSHLLTGHY